MAPIHESPVATQRTREPWTIAKSKNAARTSTYRAKANDLKRFKRAKLKKFSDDQTAEQLRKEAREELIELSKPATSIVPSDWLAKGWVVCNAKPAKEPSKKEIDIHVRKKIDEAIRDSMDTVRAEFVKIESLLERRNIETIQGP